MFFLKQSSQCVHSVGLVKASSPEFKHPRSFRQISVWVWIIERPTGPRRKAQRCFCCTSRIESSLRAAGAEPRGATRHSSLETRRFERRRRHPSSLLFPVVRANIWGSRHSPLSSCKLIINDGIMWEVGMGNFCFKGKGRGMYTNMQFSFTNYLGKISSLFRAVPPLALQKSTTKFPWTYLILLQKPACARRTTCLWAAAYFRRNIWCILTKKTMLYCVRLCGKEQLFAWFLSGNLFFSCWVSAAG